MRLNVVRITVAAQLVLSCVFLVAYFFILVMYVLGYAQVATVWRDQVGVLLGVLTAGVGSIVGFWFNRQRHQRKDEEGAESVDYVVGDGGSGLEVPETLSPLPAGSDSDLGLGDVEGSRWVPAWIRGRGSTVAGGGTAGQREVYAGTQCPRCGCRYSAGESDGSSEVEGQDGDDFQGGSGK